MTDVFHIILIALAIVLGVFSLGALVYAIRGPRFTDRVVAVNMVASMTIAMLCVLSCYLHESFILDIVLVYALLSFVAVVVLAKLVIIRRREQMEKEELEALTAASAPKKGKRRGRHG